MFMFLFFSGLAAGSTDYEFHKIGPEIPARRYSRAISYRYHTSYNVKHMSEAVAGVPWVEEDCHDDSNRFFNWSESITHSVQYSGSVGLSLMGIGLDFGADIGRETEISFERWVQATAGIRARHILMKHYENWSGVTHLETTWRDGSVTRSPEGTPFELIRVNPGLVVKRVILETCAGP